VFIFDGSGSIFGSDKMPYNQAFAITPSDTVNIPQGPCDALYVGGGGIVQGVFEDGQVTAFTAVAGETLFYKFKRVNSTSTTATLMVASYRR
jgi:hypothetical protein